MKLDSSCILLVRVLNSLSGIKTYESCCGHGLDNLRIYFTWDFIGLGLDFLAKNTSINYSKFEKNWKIIVDYKDTSPRICFQLIGVENEADDFAKFLSESFKRDNK